MIPFSQDEIARTIEQSYRFLQEVYDEGGSYAWAEITTKDKDYLQKLSNLEVVSHSENYTLKSSDMFKCHLFDTNAGDLTVILPLGSSMYKSTPYLVWVSFMRKGSNKLNIVRNSSDIIGYNHGGSSGYKIDNNESRYESRITLCLLEINYWGPGWGIGAGNFGIWRVR